MSLSSFGVSEEFLQSGVLGLELLEPLGIVGLHAAVLSKPTMPGRLGDLEMAAHVIEVLTAAEELVSLSQLPDDLIRRMPPALLRSHVDVDSFCPNNGHQESHNNWTTTAGSPHHFARCIYDPAEVQTVSLMLYVWHQRRCVRFHSMRQVSAGGPPVRRRQL